jgi:hypothetical protein
MSVVTKLRCQVTGKMYNFNPDYYSTKVQEYESEANIKKYFITKKVKTFLDRGYAIQEIRNILNVVDGELYPSESPDMLELVEFHRGKNNSISKKVANALNFTTHKSDPEVVEFINNIRNYE